MSPFALLRDSHANVQAATPVFKGELVKRRQRTRSTPGVESTVLHVALPKDCDRLGIQLGFPAAPQQPGKVIKGVRPNSILRGRVFVGDIIHTIQSKSVREHDPAALVEEAREEGLLKLKVTRHAQAAWLDSDDEEAMVVALSQLSCPREEGGELRSRKAKGRRTLDNLLRLLACCPHFLI